MIQIHINSTSFISAAFMRQGSKLSLLIHAFKILNICGNMEQMMDVTVFCAINNFIN